MMNAKAVAASLPSLTTPQQSFAWLWLRVGAWGRPQQPIAAAVHDTTKSTAAAVHDITKSTAAAAVMERTALLVMMMKWGSRSRDRSRMRSRSRSGRSKRSRNETAA